jgi:hypothetical protein
MEQHSLKYSGRELSNRKTSDFGPVVLYLVGKVQEIDERSERSKEVQTKERSRLRKAMIVVKQYWGALHFGRKEIEARDVPNRSGGNRAKTSSSENTQDRIRGFRRSLLSKRKRD